jgi:redox-sensitive bicupin YhaK (pirin superfamily)
MKTIQAKARDLGEFSVRRLLPQIGTKAIGPFVFLDHMGPVRFAPGAGIDVRPHPHIGLATITFLYQGEILHRDSLGNAQVIRPGDVNWMTAGRGIVHSERTPPKARENGASLEGLQCWVALPLEHERREPSFEHYDGQTLPRVKRDGGNIRVLVGDAFGVKSPVRAFGDVLYLDIELEAGGSLAVPNDHHELGVYAAQGTVHVNGTTIAPGTLAVLTRGADVRLEADPSARVAIVGGAPLDAPRELWWNFVASDRTLIETAKADWAQERFPCVPGDENERIPLPNQ